jgi:uncharacterized cupin superfamily protein
MHTQFLKPPFVALGLAVVLVAASALPVFQLGGTLRPAAAADAARPGIVPIPRNTALTEKGVYPPEMRVGGFNGEYKMATVSKSAVHPGNQVAFWESKAGVLKTDNYPMDEFIYVLEGHLVTTDANGTRREFRAGDTFILPKGWAGTWDMKTDFKKMLVNY